MKVTLQVEELERRDCPAPIVPPPLTKASAAAAGFVTQCQLDAMLGQMVVQEKAMIAQATAALQQALADSLAAYNAIAAAEAQSVASQFPPPPPAGTAMLIAPDNSALIVQALQRHDGQ